MLLGLPGVLDLGVGWLFEHHVPLGLLAPAGEAGWMDAVHLVLCRVL